MLFNSFPFAIFLAVVLLVYYPLPHKAQNIFLFLASCFFYASWDWRFLFPLLFSTTIDYFCAMKMQEISESGGPHAARKRYLLLSVITNLLLLGFFKYFNFFTVSLEQLLNRAGVHVDPWTLHIILPIGISFYTFQALSYTIDVYRGELHSTKNFFDFLLAILYFPHLVAGPIQRAHSLLPQVIKPRQITARKIAEGLHLMFSGYFKKVFIADNLAPIANSVFSTPHPTGFATAAGVFAFAIQIYCDFSGYTDIARGVAKIMGFEFMLNFNLPYFALNPSDFWNRWHISLSSWLRDYLYIPMGGSRVRPWKIYRNLMLTMVIGGLWHGAAWNFVLWGFYHGALLCIHRRSAPLAQKIFGATTSLGRQISLVSRIAIMFVFTCYGWLLFRAENFHQIRVMTAALMHPFQGYDPHLALTILGYASPIIVFQILQKASGKLNFLDFSWFPAEARVVFYAVSAYFVFFLGGQPASFIYFQF
jgi:D-alanyl-lipoteichoic acid acyltransferase DltB (MBOAT superfamily)